MTVRLLGATCTKVERNEAASWTFTFGDNQAGLTVDCPWRILAGGRIAFAREDRGHQFGLPAPLDGVAEGERLLSGKPMTTFLLRQDTADRATTFGGPVALELFNSSSGFEGWNISASDGLWVIALGGGQVAVFPERTSKEPGP